ncbi:RNA polymerase sigma factor [Sphingobacterium suaedae]|uniref:RNA polymerase sigma factor n=1 Tax=Sphingobacterium suaedae TaxID=1686402 RepID=A0ABW5KIJ1_9SPHI
MSEKEQFKLYESLRMGDENAFKSLYGLFFDRINFEVCRTVRCQEQAMEVVHDTFLALWQSREEVGEIRNMEAYLVTIARRLSLNQLKKNVRRSVLEKEFCLLNNEEKLGTPLENQEVLYYSWLDQAIENLPPQQQRVYKLSRHDRKKYLEIAEEMQISRDTVKKYLQLAADSIKKFLISNKDSIVSIIFCFFIFPVPPF